MNRMSKVVITVILMFVSLLSSRFAFAEDRAALKYFQKGEEYLNASKYDKALDMYKKAVDERSTDGSISIQEEKIKMVRRGRVVEKEVSYDVHYEDFFPNRRIAEIEKTLEEMAAPCDLVVTGRFQDGNTVQANNSLDPEENGVLLVTVKNSGKGAAFKTNLQISSDNSRIEYDKWVELGDIKPGDTIEKRINLRAATNVGDGRAKFILAFKEKRGKYDVSETAYVPTAKQELPQLEIIADKELDDSDGLSPNGLLDAGENAYMNLTIKNLGKGRADNTRLESTSKVTHIIFEKNIFVGDFKPGETKKIRVPLYADYELEGGKPEFNLILREERGYDSKSQPVRIMTAKLDRPKLEIEPLDIANVGDGNVGLAKGNGNHIIESGETIELMVFIKNSGVGPALGVNLVGSNITQGVNWVSGHDSAIVGTIPPGKTVKAKVAFTVPRNFNAKDISANLKVTDSRAIDKAEYKFAQNYSKKSPDLQYAYRIYSKGGLVKQIANGDDYDIELTVSNKGQLSAKNVAVSIKHGKLSDRLLLSRSQMDIGDIKEDESAPAQRVTLSVPRTYATNLAALALSIAQSDFSEINGEFKIPVEIRSPKLRYTTNLVSKNGGNSLEKGEQAVLEMQVFNDGGLPAEGVKTALSSTDDNLQILSQKEFSIGTIPPGTSGEPVKYEIIAKGRLAVGPAKLSVDISQNEFESKGEQYALNILEGGATIIDMGGENRPKTAVAASSLAGPKINIKGLESVTAVIEDETYPLAFEVADVKNIATITVLVNGSVVAIKEAANLALKAAKSKHIVQDIPLDEGENRIVITAYNSDNVPSKKEFTVTRATEEDIDTPKFLGQRNPNAVAVVIGISKFKNDIPAVAYARRDAETVKEYLIKTLGYSEAKIKTFYDEDASVTDLKSYFAVHLRNKIKPGVSDVFVFYSGHGTPDTNTQEPYFVPYDFNPSDPVNTGLAANVLYKQIGELGAKSVTIVLDSCFSGKSSDGKLLIKGVSAGLLKSKDPFFGVKNGVLLAAATKEQPASWYDKKQHGLFTYYFLQGLQGAADYDKDGMITVEELSAYTRNKVSEQALVLHNREQTPEVKGDGATVVVKYK